MPPAGWNGWCNIPTHVSVVQTTTTPAVSPETKPTVTTSVAEIINMPFGKISNIILPASKFWIWAPTSNNQLQVPWNHSGLDDALLMVAQGGFTAMGAAAGLTVMAQTLAQAGTVTYAIGQDVPHRPPIVAYCIGDLYSERLYTTITAMRNDIDGSTIVTDAADDVHQRYVLKRYYLHHGEVTSYTPNQDNTATIGLGVSFHLSPDLMKSTGSLTVTKSDGTRWTFTVQSFTSDCQAKVSVEKAFTPAAGDFYVFDTLYVLEDPYLMAGFFKGNENDVSGSWKSGYNLPITFNQTSYIQTSLAGGYALRNKKTGKIVPGGVGQNMDDTDELTWEWVYFNKKSTAYTNNKNRFRPLYTSDTSIEPSNADLFQASAYYPTYQYRLLGKEANITAMAEQKVVKHIRVELAHTGCTQLNNFHAPILTREYIEQKGKYFKILSQIDGSIIDLSYMSVDGSTKFDLHGDFRVLNQFAWKCNEHYSGNNRNPFGRGKVVAVESSTSPYGTTMITLDMQSDYLSKGTVADNSATGGFNKPSCFGESRNSFYRRFTSEYAFKNFTKSKQFYVKGQRWVLQSTIVKPQKNYTITYADTKDTASPLASTTTQIKLYTNNTVDKEIVGTEYHIFFDTPFDNATFNVGGGSLSGTDDGRGGIAVDGNFASAFVIMNIPSNTYLGICDAWAWGLSIGLQYPMGTPFYITTPSGNLMTSSLFMSIPFEECVLYQDTDTRKMVLRTGALSFDECPAKKEIAIGNLTKDTLSAAGNVLTLNQTYERLNALELSSLKPETDAKKMFITFDAQDVGNKYGFVASGNEIKLQAFAAAGMDDVTYAKLQFNGQNISPAYAYTYSYKHQQDSLRFPIGLATTTNQQIMSYAGLDTPLNVGTTQAYYVNENQTIENAGIYLILPDGERIVVYQQRFPYDMIIGGQDVPEWTSTSNAIMITGSNDDGRTWGAPIIKKNEYTQGIETLPVMVLNACDLADVLYDEYIHSFNIFTNAYDQNGLRFVGLFRVPLMSLANQNGARFYFGHNKDLKITNPATVKASDYVASDMPFVFRVPQLPATLLSDASLSYTSEKNLYDEGYGDVLPSAEDDANATDSFVRILGLKASSPQIVQEGSYGVVSARQFDSGLQVLFYDSASGIRMAYSKNSGMNWYESAIILARDGTCGFMIDDKYFYYTAPSDGLKCKNISIGDIEQFAALPMEGVATKTAELIQADIDKRPTVVMGTGELQVQKFSGYVNNVGCRKVFYYTKENNLSCVQSTDGQTWKIAPNF